MYCRQYSSLLNEQSLVLPTFHINTLRETTNVSIIRKTFTIYTYTQTVFNFNTQIEPDKLQAGDTLTLRWLNASPAQHNIFNAVNITKAICRAV